MAGIYSSLIEIFVKFIGNAKLAIPPLDPYFIPKLIMSPNKNVGGVVLEMKNASTYGFSKALVKKVQ